jgi:hypothetical protein
MNQIQNKPMAIDSTWLGYEKAQFAPALACEDSDAHNCFCQLMHCELVAVSSSKCCVSVFCVFRETFLEVRSHAPQLCTGLANMYHCSNTTHDFVANLDAVPSLVLLRVVQ